MQPPFTLDLQWPASPCHFRWQLTLKYKQQLLEFQSEEEEGKAPVGALECVAFWVETINDQCFPYSTKQHASMVLTKHTWDRSTLTLGFAFDCLNVPQDCLWPLLALLSQTHYAYEPIRTLELKLNQFNGPTLTVSKFFEGRSNGLRYLDDYPFTIQDWPPEHWHRVDIHYRLTKPLSHDDRERVSDTLNTWDHLHVLGGFHFEFTEIDLIPFNPIRQTDHHTMTLHLSNYQGHPTGTQTLLNLGLGLYDSPNPLQSISFEL